MLFFFNSAGIFVRKSNVAFIKSYISSLEVLVVITFFWRADNTYDNDLSQKLSIQLPLLWGFQGSEKENYWNFPKRSKKLSWTLFRWNGHKNLTMDVSGMNFCSIPYSEYRHVSLIQLTSCLVGMANEIRFLYAMVLHLVMEKWRY